MVRETLPICQHLFLRIKMNDGTAKNVEDYGKRGSEKLKVVYQFFEYLKQNQTWTKVK